MFEYASHCVVPASHRLHCERNAAHLAPRQRRERRRVSRNTAAQQRRACRCVVVANDFVCRATTTTTAARDDCRACVCSQCRHTILCHTLASINMDKKRRYASTIIKHRFVKKDFEIDLLQESECGRQQCHRRGQHSCAGALCWLGRFECGER